MKRKAVNRQRMRMAAACTASEKEQHQLQAHGRELQRAARAMRRDPQWADYLAKCIVERAGFTTERAQEYVSKFKELDSQAKLLELEATYKSGKEN